MSAVTVKVVNAVGALTLVVGLIFSGGMLAAEAADSKMLEEGKAIAFDRKKGNCLSCHMIQDGELPGNTGPPLIAMKARYPDIEALRAQIWDPTVKNPQSMMPPFGKHLILKEDELDKVVAFIHSL